MTTMKKILTVFMFVLMSFCVVINSAEARRFGGGKSFGSYRPTSSYSRMQSPQSANLGRNTALNGNRWLGPLAGLAMGGLLASLFMGNGIANGMMSWLMVLGVILLILNVVRSFSRNRMQPVARGNIYQMQQENTGSNQAPIFSQFVSSIPSDFNEAEFVRNIKVQFIRLQAAYDKKDLNDIRQYTSPEVYGEIKMQLDERKDTFNHTEVVTLDARLLEVSTEGNANIASVEFSGLIKEENNPAISFKEIWHLRKDSYQPTWQVYGIEQI